MDHIDIPVFALLNSPCASPVHEDRMSSSVLQSVCDSFDSFEESSEPVAFDSSTILGDLCSALFVDQTDDDLENAQFARWAFDNSSQSPFPHSDNEEDEKHVSDYLTSAEYPAEFVAVDSQKIPFRTLTTSPTLISPKFESLSTTSAMSSVSSSAASSPSLKEGRKMTLTSRKRGSSEDLLSPTASTPKTPRRTSASFSTTPTATESVVADDETSPSSSNGNNSSTQSASRNEFTLLELAQQLNMNCRFRDCRRSLLENAKMTSDQMSVIRSRPEFQSLVLQSSTRRMSLARFCRLVLVLVFHFAVRDGRLPGFWKRMNHSLLVQAIRRDMADKNNLPDCYEEPFSPEFEANVSASEAAAFESMESLDSQDDDGEKADGFNGQSSDREKRVLNAEMMDLIKEKDWLLVCCHPDVGLQAFEYVKQRMNVKDAVARAQREAVVAFFRDGLHNKS
eukprot:ANDGO_07530.mRNA.1 hypothetical protein